MLLSYADDIVIFGDPKINQISNTIELLENNKKKMRFIMNENKK